MLLRDILADWLIDRVAGLISEPNEKVAYAKGILPVMDMRLARYKKEKSETKQKPKWRQQ